MKYLLSQGKHEWTVRDYPDRLREQHPIPVPNGAYAVTPPRWSAQIVNWWQMGGLGETQTEALESLAANMRTFAAKRPLPRPGTRVPIEFASTKIIDSHAQLLGELIDLLGEGAGQILFTSDEAYLSDVIGDVDPAEARRRIQDRFQVDVPNAPAMRLGTLLELIAAG